MVGVPWNIRHLGIGKKWPRWDEHLLDWNFFFGGLLRNWTTSPRNLKKANFLPEGLEPWYPAWSPSVITIYIIMAKLLFHPGDSNLGIMRERWLQWPPTSWQTGAHKIRNLCVSFYVQYNTILLAHHTKKSSIVVLYIQKARYSKMIFSRKVGKTTPHRLRTTVGVVKVSPETRRDRRVWLKWNANLN